MTENDYIDLELSSGAGTPSSLELRTVAGETYVPPSTLQQLRRVRAAALATARGARDTSQGQSTPNS